MTTPTGQEVQHARPDFLTKIEAWISSPAVDKHFHENETTPFEALEFKGSEYEKWYNDPGKLATIGCLLVERIETHEKTRAPYDYIVGLGRSGTPLAQWAGKVLQKRVACFSESFYQFPMKREIMPLVSYVIKSSTEKPARILLIDSVVRTGMSATIAIGYIRKAHEKAGLAMPDVTILCVQLWPQLLSGKITTSIKDTLLDALRVSRIENNLADVNHDVRDREEIFDWFEEYACSWISLHDGRPQLGYVPSILASPFDQVNENTTFDKELPNAFNWSLEAMERDQSLYLNKENKPALQRWWKAFFQRKIAWDGDASWIDGIKRALDQFSKGESNPLLDVLRASRDEYVNKYKINPDTPWPFRLYITMFIDKYLNAGFNSRPLYMTSINIVELVDVFSERVTRLLDHIEEEQDEDAIQNHVLEELTKIVNFLVNFHHVSYDKHVMCKIQGDIKERASQMLSLFGSIDEWAVFHEPSMMEAIASNLMDQLLGLGDNPVKLVVHDLPSIALASRMVAVAHERGVHRVWMHFLRDNIDFDPPLHATDLGHATFVLPAGCIRFPINLHLPLKALTSNGVPIASIHVMAAFNCSRSPGLFQDAWVSLPEGNVHAFWDASDVARHGHGRVRPEPDDKGPLTKYYADKKTLLEYMASRIA